MNFDDIKAAAKIGYGIVEETTSALGKLQAVYQATQKLRFQVFLNGCRKALQEEGDTTSGQDQRLLNLVTEGEFPQSHVYDFLKQIVDSNSKIAQYALAKLYVRCASKRPVATADRDEITLMKGYRDLDDRDVKVLLLVDEISSANSAHSQTLSMLNYPANRLEMHQADFNHHEGKFRELACSTGFDLATLMDTFAQKSLVDRLPSQQADILNPLLFRYGRNNRTDAFLNDLRWARDQMDN